MPYEPSEDEVKAVQAYIEAGVLTRESEIANETAEMSIRTHQVRFAHPQFVILMTVSVQIEALEHPEETMGEILLRLVTGVQIPTHKMHVAVIATLCIEGVDDFTRYYTSAAEPFCEHASHQCEFYTEMVLAMVILQNVMGITDEE